MNDTDIRAVALGGVRRPDTGEWLVQRLAGDAGGHFHRFVGGGVHPGETSAAAVEREFREELDARVVAGGTLWTVENLFTYAGEAHHELAVVREAAFGDDSLYDRERFAGVDTGDVEYEAYWRSLADLRAAEAPFFPDGVGDLLAAASTAGSEPDPGEGADHLVSPDPAAECD